MEIKDLEFTYKKSNYKTNKIFNKVNFSFEKGKITSIIGSNGCGKTTLLEIINNNLKYQKGKIIGNQKLGYMPQISEDIFIYSTVRDNFIEILEESNYEPYQYIKRIIDSLIMVGLDESYINKDIVELSESDTRKIVLAMALLTNPKILILDEPTIYFDEVSKKNLIKIIRTLKNRYSKTIIIASNDIEFIHKISDYIYVVDNKKVLLEGNKYDVFKNIELLKKHHIDIPKEIVFSDAVYRKKNIKIGYRDDINDLLKDIYRFVR